VPTGYGYILPDQNGWSRSLHFQSAWLLVFAGLVYVVGGFLSGHFPKNLIPRRSDVSWRAVSGIVAQHLSFKPPGIEEGWSYNVLQRITYLLVIFVLFPLVIWTGLAMSPAFDSAIPATVRLLGGRQSARTLHFLISIALVIFVTIHFVLVWRAGFVSRVRAMISGNAIPPREGTHD
jgi:thiosulfate reductase cytochrome b subunit